MLFRWKAFKKNGAKVPRQGGNGQRRLANQRIKGVLPARIG